jgi:hypothetical protein
MPKPSFQAIAAATLISCLLPLQAATITQYTRATFPSTVNGVSVITQNFDSLPGNQTISTVGDVTFSASLGSPLVTGLYFASTPFYTLGSTSDDGGGFFDSLFVPSETATFSFAKPITAFAIDITSNAPVGGAYQAELSTGDKILSQYAPFIALDPFSQSGRQTIGQFIGFVSDTPFNSVTISALPVDRFGTGFSLATYAYVLDTLRYAEAPVPEPSTLFSLAPALLALGYYSHRKIHNNKPRS